MEKKDLKWEEEMISSVHFLEEVVEVDPNNNKKFKLPKKPSTSLLNKSIMDKWLKSSIQGPDVVKNAVEKVVRILKNVNHAKDKEELCKCIKWVLECISKSKRLVISVQAKDKLLEKEGNVKFAKEKRSWKRKN